MMLVLLALGCPKSVIADYNAARDEVLAPVPAPSKGAPQFQVELAWTALAPLAELALGQAVAGLGTTTMKGPLGVTAELTPALRVDGISLARSGACATCVAVNGRMAGDVEVAVSGAKAGVPLDGPVQAVLALDLAQEGSSWVVHAKVQSLDAKALDDLSVRGLKVGSVIAPAVEKAVTDRPKFELTRFTPPAALGLGLVWIAVDDGGLAVDARTGMSGAEDLASMGASSNGWGVRVAAPTLLTWVRRAAFEKGVVSNNIAIDPRGLQVDGDHFVATVRLWLLDGRGWWRDISLKGGWSVVNGVLALRANQADIVDESPGAALVDPIAFLGESKILEAVAAAAQATFPTTSTTKLGSSTVTFSAQSVTGADGVVLAGGLIRLTGGHVGATLAVPPATGRSAAPNAPHAAPTREPGHRPGANTDKGRRR